MSYTMKEKHLSNKMSNNWDIIESLFLSYLIKFIRVTFELSFFLCNFSKVPSII